jgi:hypothetical protein
MDRPSTFMDVYGPSLLWAAYAVQFPLLRLIAPSMEKADDGGRVWRLRDFLDSAIILSTYTMIFVAATSAIIAYRRLHAAQR